jgi:GT2 family glycosyltransferase
VNASARSVHVLVVGYGPPDGMRTSLELLDGAYPVTVVDNSSSPTTKEVATSSGATYLDPGANVGFAKAVNLGIRNLDLESTDVLLLNPDARIEPADIEKLERCLEQEPEAACAAPWHRSDGTESLSSPLWPWDTPARAWAEALGIHDLGSGGGFLSGAVLLLRGEAVGKLGPLDERFFMYAEDQDWQRRALEGGWKLHHCRAASAWHRMGGTDTDLSRVRLRLHAATELYVRKWYGPLGWATFRGAWLFGQLGRVVLYTLVRSRRAARPSALGLVRMYATGPVRSARQAGVIPHDSDDTAAAW